MIAFRQFARSTLKGAVRRTPVGSAVKAQVRGRCLSTGAVAQEPESLMPYAIGCVSGLAMYGAGRYLSISNKVEVAPGSKEDYSSQEFRDKSMNEGMLEACAGGLEWGGIAWTFLSIAQVLENRFSKNPFLSLIGAPRIALLVTGSACAGFAIRGEEKLIVSARKPLLEKKID